MAPHHRNRSEFGMIGFFAFAGLLAFISGGEPPKLKIRPVQAPEQDQIAEPQAFGSIAAKLASANAVEDREPAAELAVVDNLLEAIEAPQAFGSIAAKLAEANAASELETRDSGMAADRIEEPQAFGSIAAKLASASAEDELVAGNSEAPLEQIDTPQAFGSFAAKLAGNNFDDELTTASIPKAKPARLQSASATLSGRMRKGAQAHHRMARLGGSHDLASIKGALPGSLSGLAAFFQRLAN